MNINNVFELSSTTYYAAKIYINKIVAAHKGLHGEFMKCEKNVFRNCLILLGFFNVCKWTD